jgi:NAD(P)-dependent dehydrogenase (short-subunit alcohol dehydrogenase family)
MAGRIENKVAIITGGARGIGKATCRILAQQGAKLVVTDIVDDEGKNVAEELRKDGWKAQFYHLDTSVEKEVSSVFGQINDKLGSIDVLVNNAGISGTNDPTHEISESDWQKVIDINVNGVFFCTKHAVRYMLNQSRGGSIINLSSIYGIISAPDLPAYHASKGAVRLMTKTDALLYAKDGIRVNSVHPGYIWTPLVEELASRSEEGIEKFQKNLAGKHPVGRVGEPEDIAYGILYLASDEAKFVTGSELVIDGGYTAQ